MTIASNRPPSWNSRVVTFILSTIAALGFGIGSGIVYAVQVPREGKTEVKYSRQPLTLTEYGQLKIGMSLDEVELILSKGIEESRGVTGVAFKWENADNSYIKVIFENDVLKSKEQFGLAQYSTCIQ